MSQDQSMNTWMWCDIREGNVVIVQKNEQKQWMWIITSMVFNQKAVYHMLFDGLCMHITLLMGKCVRI